MTDRLRVLIADASTIEAYGIQLVHGNVKLAEHGAPVADETLGGGTVRDAVVFDLGRSPDTPTLWITVDGSPDRRLAALVLAEQVSKGAYRVLLEDDGTAVLAFGDGAQGRPPPASSENVRAVYRRGGGAGGSVAAQTITILSERPPGLSRVANPVEASGGADPETADEARRQAPKSVSILDRTVSERDYEDFVRTLAGVAKTVSGKSRPKEKRTKRKCRIVEITIPAEGGC